MPRSRQAELFAARQAAGLCRACASPPEPGRALCLTHLVRQRERKRARDAARKAKGACVEGGCGRAPAGGHVRCGPCHRKFSAANLKWQRENR